MDDSPSPTCASADRTAVTVAYTGAGAAAFEPETQDRHRRQSRCRHRPVVRGASDRRAPKPSPSRRSRDTVFSSARTGAATSVSRARLATLPTISGRIGDITRLTPQASGMSFAGQDNRLNNITVDGSYFNNSFGLGGAPGERTGVAPISLEAIEQVQVNVAPFDVRQGNFVGAGVNTVTRSGTNQLPRLVLPPLPQRGLRRHRGGPRRSIPARSTSATPAAGPADRSSGTGCSSSATIENEEDRAAAAPRSAPTRRRAGRRQHHPRARVGPRHAECVPVAATSTTRPAPYQDYDAPDAASAASLASRLQPQQQQQGELPLQPARFEHRRAAVELGARSASAAARVSTDWPELPGLELPDSREHQVGHRRMELDDRQHDVQQPDRRLHQPGREPRRASARSSRSSTSSTAAQSYTSFGSEPFTPNNELRYNTFQLQDNFTRVRQQALA